MTKKKKKPRNGEYCTLGFMYSIQGPIIWGIQHHEECKQCQNAAKWWDKQYKNPKSKWYTGRK